MVAEQLCQVAESVTYSNNLDELHMTTRIHSKPFIYSRVSSVISVASVFAMLVATAVQAAEWRIEPLIGVAGDYDDNSILTTRTDADADISGYVIGASARIAYASDTSEFSITPRLRFRDYGDGRTDADDLFLDFGFEHDTQSTNFRLRGDYESESARTAERADSDLGIEDPDEILDDDTALLSLLADRERLNLKPKWTYRFSNVSELSVGLNYRDVQYDEDTSGRLSDYTNARANITYERSISPRNTAILSGTYRQFESDGRGDVSGASFNAGVARTLSETTRLRATVGVEETDLGTVGSDQNFVADVSLNRNLQTITMLAQYRRSVSGGGNGTLSSRDSINLSFKRQMTERIAAGLGVRAYQTNALSDAIVMPDDREYLQLHSQFTWNLTRKWFVEANYRYTFSDSTALGESANSNQVTIWLNYQPNPIIRSR